MRRSIDQIREAAAADSPQEAAETLTLRYNRYAFDSRWDMCESLYERMKEKIAGDAGAFGSEESVDDVLQKALEDDVQGSVEAAYDEAGLKHWHDGDLFGIRLPGGIIAIEVEGHTFFNVDIPEVSEEEEYRV